LETNKKYNLTWLETNKKYNLILKAKAQN
jgi:hypothetical protein